MTLDEALWDLKHGFTKMGEILEVCESITLSTGPDRMLVAWINGEKFEMGKLVAAPALFNYPQRLQQPTHRRSRLLRGQRQVFVSKFDH